MINHNKVIRPNSISSLQSMERFQSVSLPSPFGILDALHDSRAKGSWIIVVLSQELTVYILKCPPNIRIQYHPYYSCHSVLTFIECSNHTHQSVGLLALVVKKSGIGNAFESMEEGVSIEQGGTLCLCQGIVKNEQDEFCFVVHELKDRLSLTQSLQHLLSTSLDTISVCKELFQAGPVLYKEKDVSIKYLNQIGGPSHSGWNTKPRLFIEEGISFVESRLQADSWCNQFITKETSQFNFLTMRSISPQNGCEVKVRVNRRKRKDHIVLNLGMKKILSRSQSFTDVFYCRPLPKLTEVSKKKKIQLVELLTDNPFFVTAVPITQDQFEEFENVYRERMSITYKEHNEVLLGLLKANRMSLMKLTNLSPNRYGCTDSFIISLLPQGQPLPCGDNISNVSPTICKTRLKDNVGGSLDVCFGSAVQFVYSWPYERVIEKSHVLFLDQCIPRSNSNRNVALCSTGSYQNLGWRTTSQASGSMVSSPLNTKYHHVYHKGLNQSLLPFLTNLRNHLREQAKVSCLHVGEPFLHSLLKTKASGTRVEEILRGTLITWGGFSNTVHYDKRDFMTEDDSKSVTSFLKDQDSMLCNRLLYNYQETFPGKKLPLPTTCCWCPVMVGDQKEYLHRQFFVNLTCGISIDISSIAFNESSPQIGSTFFGGLFEHCTMRPLWLNLTRCLVRVKPPESSPSYWNFAWGEHP